VRARGGEKLLVLVEAEHAPGRSDALAQQVSDAARPAADVEAGPSRLHPDPIQHHARVGRDRLGLDVQALDLAPAMLDRVMACEVVGHGGSHYAYRLRMSESASVMVEMKSERCNELRYPLPLWERVAERSEAG